MTTRRTIAWASPDPGGMAPLFAALWMFTSPEQGLVWRSAVAVSLRVSVESVDALERAYPDCFLDTHVFIDVLNKVLKRSVIRRTFKG